MMKRNDGFTMVELLVTIVAAAVVTIAAASLILLGTRIRHASTADAAEQQNVRIVLTMLEKMAGNGEISSVENNYSGWELKGESGTLFQYDAQTQVLYNGAKETGAVLLKDLNGAGARMDGKVLHFTFDTVRGGSYETAIYCRALEIQEGITETNEVEDVIKDAATDDLMVFLQTLVDEYKDGKNSGMIQNQIDGDDAYDYYSEWYIKGYNNNGWNEDTPWCACFLSWAAVKSGVITRDDPYCFANVDEGIKKFALKSAPAVGDYVFFDWSGEKKDPAHVGVVLNVVDDKIYTIEGNSGGVIAVRQYPLGSNVIMGYGTLPAFAQTP